MSEINYKNPTGITLISRIIKNQNVELLEKICKKYDLDEEVYEELKYNFIKVNYYSPNIILDSHKESLQKYFVDKY